MYEKVYEPVAGSLALSALVAAIPIVVLFVLLAGVKVAAQWASLATLAVRLVIAVLVYGMPVGLALDSTLLGAAFGLLPIVWIVLTVTCLSASSPDSFPFGPPKLLLAFYLRTKKYSIRGLCCPSGLA